MSSADSASPSRRARLYLDIAHRDALSSTARRVLLRTMKEAAKRLRSDADRAEQRAQRFDELVAQLDDPKQD